MLQKAIHDLKGDAILARDGRIGSVDDVYFDDEKWAVRYFVVDTGEWLPGRRVLISPASLAPAAMDPDSLLADLSKAQVENAPGTGAAPPISRALEEAHAKYYGYNYYWAGPYLWGAAEMPLGPLPDDPHQPEHEQELRAAEARAKESHLRSSREVVGYRIRAADGELGHVEDFLVD